MFFYPYFIYIEDLHEQLLTIDYQNLWSFGNSFFQRDNNVETLQGVINQMIVIEKSLRIDIDGARSRVLSVHRAEKIREAGENALGYKPSKSDIREAGHESVFLAGALYY